VVVMVINRLIKQCYKTIEQVEKKNQKSEDGLTDLEEIIFNYFLR